MQQQLSGAVTGDTLSRAVSDAAEQKGWAWVAGVLEGAVCFRWDPERTAAYLRDEA
jgi:hypothetical protein